MPRDAIQSLQQLMGHGGEQAFNLVPFALERVIREELWRERADAQGKPFTSFEAFIAHRLWHGLETTVDDLRAFCRKRPDVVALIDGVMTPLATVGRPIANAEVNADTISINRRRSHGTSATYRRKRLKRDRPDLFERFRAGELKLSQAEAMAGRKIKTPLEHLRHWWKKAGDDEREAFLAEVSA